MTKSSANIVSNPQLPSSTIHNIHNWTGKQTQIAPRQTTTTALFLVHLCRSCHWYTFVACRRHRHPDGATASMASRAGSQHRRHRGWTIKWPRNCFEYYTVRLRTTVQCHSRTAMLNSVSWAARRVGLSRDRKGVNRDGGINRNRANREGSRSWQGCNRDNDAHAAKAVRCRPKG